MVIAMAMAGEPRLLIAEEPMTALDVTFQTVILTLMDWLKRETGTVVMFITHDMAVVAQMADRVVVMYSGFKVEERRVEDIFANSQYNYTKSLLAAVPKLSEIQNALLPEPMRILGTQEQVLTPIKGTVTPLLTVQNLATRFPVKGRFLRWNVANVHAVEDMFFYY